VCVCVRVTPQMTLGDLLQLLYSSLLFPCLVVTLIHQCSKTRLYICVSAGGATAFESVLCQASRVFGGWWRRECADNEVMLKIGARFWGLWIDGHWILCKEEPRWRLYCRLDDVRMTVRCMTGARDFPLLQSVHTGSCVAPNPVFLGTGRCFRVNKAAGSWN
jgi:hypothetical protein